MHFFTERKMLVENRQDSQRIYMYSDQNEKVQPLQIEQNKYVSKRDLDDEIGGAHLTSFE